MMADPLSVTASSIAVITLAIKAAKSLHGTVSRYKGRNKTLGRLQNELQGTIDVMESLEQVIQTEESMAKLLKGPVSRCQEICDSFAKSMKAFAEKDKAGFLDWTKLEFMKGDINEFIDTISGYKSTISVGLATITIQSVKVSQKVLEEYNDMIQDTVYELNVRLQRVDERISGYTGDNLTTLASDINLDDEREVTKMCLQICEDAKAYLESLINQGSHVIGEPQNTDADNESREFEAQLLTRQALGENRESIARIIGQLRQRLEKVMQNGADDQERSRLIEDINMSKQCLEVCKVASEVSSQKVYRIGEVVAEGDCDQVVVTTLADLFDVKKALAKGTSIQLVGSMTAESLQDLTEKRYSSRYAATTPSNSNVQTGREKNTSPKQKGPADDSSPPITTHRGQSSNEVRRRT